VATFNHISGAEPSTITFKAATVSMTRNSSVMHQEIISIGDPDSSLAVAVVTNAVPASTAWGLVTREAGGVLSSLGGIVQIQGNSTVFQGGAPWSVSQVAGSTWSVRAQNSTAADLLATVSQGTNPWTVAGNCTVAPLAGSTWAVRPIQSSAADMQVTATPAAGSTFNVRALQSSAADLQVTVTPVSTTWQVQEHGDSTVIQGTSPWVVAGASTVAPLAGSTWATRPIQSSAADLQMTATIGGNLQSTTYPSTGSSGLVVREALMDMFTTSSTSAFASTSLTIQSSAAATRMYVTAYSITTTAAGPSKIAFYSSGTMVWPIMLAAVSSAVSGVNLAVSYPSYLFRTVGANDALTLQLGGGASTSPSWRVGVSYFKAP